MPRCVRAAELATAFAGGDPLIFGGDLNLRPRQHPAAFDELRERFGLAAPTGPRAIDHLLAAGLDTVEPAAALPDARAGGRGAARQAGPAIRPRSRRCRVRHEIVRVAVPARPWRGFHGLEERRRNGRATAKQRSQAERRIGSRRRPPGGAEVEFGRCPVRRERQVGRRGQARQRRRQAVRRQAQARRRGQGLVCPRRLGAVEVGGSKSGAAKRSAAAKKAAATRKAATAKRSAAAKKGAAKRTRGGRAPSTAAKARAETAEVSAKTAAELREAISKRLIDPLDLVMLTRERIEDDGPGRRVSAAG